MQATGASHGYLISWSRNDVSVHCLQYNPAFIHSAAKVLKFAIEAFVNPEGTPANSVKHVTDGGTPQARMGTPNSS